MKSELARAGVHAAQLAAAVFIAIYLEPWATKSFPDAPLWLVLACLALIGAVAVELLTLAVVGRPTAELVWHEEQDPNALSEIRPHMPTSLVYTVKVNLSGGSWLTWLAVWRLITSDAFISVRFPSSPAKVVIDRAPRDPITDGMRVLPNDANGFDLQLANNTRPSTLWTWADLRFETAQSAHSGVPIDTIYKCVGSGFITGLSAKVLIVKSDVKIVRFRSP